MIEQHRIPGGTSRGHLTCRWTRTLRLRGAHQNLNLTPRCRGERGGWEKAAGMEVADLTSPTVGPALRCRGAGRDPAILGGSPRHGSPSATPAQSRHGVPGVPSFTPAVKALEEKCLILPLEPQHIVYAPYYFLGVFFFCPSEVGLYWLLWCWWCPTACRAFKAERWFLGCAVELISHS